MGGSSAIHASAVFYSGDTQCHLKPSFSRGRSARGGKSHFHLGFDPRTVQTLKIRYTVYDILPAKRNLTQHL
jgi:hypothetical protein